MNERLSRRRRDQKGFTFLELMMAVSLFSVGVLGAVTMAGMVMKNNKMSENMTTAAELARNKIEALQIMPYAEIANSSEEQLDATGISGGGIYKRLISVSSASNPGEPHYKEIEVRVSWKTPRWGVVVLKTIIAE